MTNLGLNSLRFYRGFVYQDVIKLGGIRISLELI